MKSKIENHYLPFKARPIHSLLIATCICLAFQVGRIMATGKLTHIHLVWNLFLAWIPVVIVYVLHQESKENPDKIATWKYVSLLFFWLLFFPNSPYLVSDLIHLKINTNTIAWFDAVMIFSYAFAGICLTLASLFLVHKISLKYATRFTAWITILFSIVLSGYGIFIGRILRWNSWDIFVNPISLFKTIIAQVDNPKAIAMTLTYSFLIFALYVFFLSLINQLRNVRGQGPFLGNEDRIIKVLSRSTNKNIN